MPSESVKLTEIRSKVGVEEDPPLARFRGFDAALAGVQAQDGGRHAQELRRFVQVECAHGLLLSMVAHRHVVATRLRPGLPPDISPNALGEDMLRRIEVGLHGVQELA